MTLTRLYAIPSDGPQSFEGRNYFVNKRGRSIPVTPKERKGWEYQEGRSLDENVLSQFAEDNKPQGATHFYTIRMPNHCIIIYYKV